MYSKELKKTVSDIFSMDGESAFCALVSGAQLLLTHSVADSRSG